MPLIVPDPRWETMELLYPGRKPAGPVQIDWAHPMARGLRVCVIPQGKSALVDLVAGGLSEGTAPTNGGDLVLDNTSKILVNIQPFQNDKFTLLWAGTAEAAGSWDAWGGLVALPASAGATSCIAVQRNSSTADLWMYAGAASFPLITGIGGLATPSALVLTYDKAVNVSYAYEYLNGVSLGSISGTHESKTSDLQLGINVERALDVTNAGAQLFKCFFLWGRKLSAEEVKAVSENLYQFLIPA